MTVAELESLGHAATGPVPGAAAEAVTTTPAAPELTEEERHAVRLFLAHVNGWRTARSYSALTAGTAVKFLMARKFNVDRALKLYRQHEMMRVREGLDVIDLEAHALRQEVETGKFTVLSTRDPHGAALAIFNVKLHYPSTTTHKTTLQGVIHQLDVALEDTLTQRGGLVFVYNMSGSKMSNFDYELSQKILTLLKGCYPARLKKVRLGSTLFFEEAVAGVSRIVLIPLPSPRAGRGGRGHADPSLKRPRGPPRPLSCFHPRLLARPTSDDPPSAPERLV